MRVLTMLVFCGSHLYANAIYTYVGNNFTDATPGYTTSDFVSASVTLISPLPFDSPLTSYTPLGFSISDGVMTFKGTSCYLNSSCISVFFATSGGQITSWSVGEEINTPRGGGPFIGTVNSPLGVEDVTGHGFPLVGGGINLAGNSGSPGMWSLAFIDTPEPASLSTVVFGALFLAFLLRRG